MTKEQRKKLREDCALVIRLEDKAGLSDIQPRFNASAHIVLELLYENERMREALKKIAGIDFRGNMPDGVQIAREALEESGG